MYGFGTLAFVAFQYDSILVKIKTKAGSGIRVLTRWRQVRLVLAPHRSREGTEREEKMKYSLMSDAVKM